MNERSRLLAAQLRHRRALGIQPPRRRLPRQTHPMNVQREYARRLLLVVDLAWRSTESLRGALPGLLAQVEASRRHDADEGRRIREIIEGAKAVLEQSLDTDAAEDLARDVAVRTEVHNREQLGRQTRAALGADVYAQDRRLPAVVDGFVAENVALIKDLPRNLLREIEQIVSRAVASATPHTEVAKVLAERHDIARDRAKLIARDQVGKLYGQVNAVRQQDMGVTQFIWRTVRDRRVRGTPGGAFPNAKPSHYDREGKTYLFAEPPEGGLPGVPILCRCNAEPDFTAIIAGADE